MFSKETYVFRRKKLAAQVGTGLMLFLGNEESGMNYQDNWYPFRQDSSFLYFFGLDKANLIAIIDIDNNHEILFGNELTLDEIVWNGYQQPLQQQAERTGITDLQSLPAMEGVLRTAITRKQQVHFLPPYRTEHSEKLSHWLNIPSPALRQAASVSMIKGIVAQRSIKSQEEIREIEKAILLTGEMQLAAMRTTQEGITEAAVAGKVHGAAISGGGNLSFPIILTVNGQILHNHYTNEIMPAGGMVLCDCGAETAMHYAGDLTRTFPVGKRFSNQQKELYNIVLAAHDAAAVALQPGRLFRDIHLLACEQLVAGLQLLGLMKGDIKESVAAGAHALFFFVHDQPYRFFGCVMFRQPVTPLLPRFGVETIFPVFQCIQLLSE